MKLKKKKLNVKNYKIAGYNSIKKLTIALLVFLIKDAAPI